MRSAQLVEQDLVLVGGGHTHVLVLRALAMRPLPGLRITLISPSAFTPYSGMLPGLLAGHYRFEDTHIDLARLCQWAGVRFLADEVLSLDRESRRLRCRQRGDVGYDFASIDIGSQPELDSVPGARQYSVPVKPVAGLWQRWQDLQTGDPLPARVAVVGGGAGSVEIALAIAHRFTQTPGQAPMQIDLYCGAAEILAGYGARVRRAVTAQCAVLGVQLNCDHRVLRVEEGRMYFSGDREARFDTLFWCTGAAAARWIAASGLPVDERGFMTVHDTLASSGDERVFGAGDIAVQQAHPRPKAGVYAVRQAPVLAHNLRARARGEGLREHRPQQRFLSLLSLGPKLAVAERSGLSAKGAWVWRWKDRIDRSFMQRFKELPEKAMDSDALAVAAQAPCGGCGAKVGGATLRDVLGALVEPRAELDDAAWVDPGQPLLQSTDTLRALIDDPWLMGRIAAQHALSDIYASGARPHSALAQLTLPFAVDEVLRRDLAQLLDGALTVLTKAGCALIGGHSMQGPEMQVGFTVNGVLDGHPPLRKRGAQVGDRLVLGKALGSGCLFAAHMQGRADGRHVEAALAAMQQGNGEAASIARRCDAHALTDVTGFGVAGHLLEMLDDTLGAQLDLASLPLLDGALEALGAGIVSTLQAQNTAYAGDRIALPTSSPAAAQLLFDPQTSGGLLMAIPDALAERALAELRDAGYAAAIVGVVTQASADRGPALRVR